MHIILQNILSIVLLYMLIWTLNSVYKQGNCISFIKQIKLCKWFQFEICHGSTFLNLI